jgi:hypothetical protein
MSIMLKLEEITKQAALTGIEPGQVVRVVTTEPVGDNALTVYYKTSDGRLLERMLFRTDEATLALAEAGRPWAFDAPGVAFKLAAEAYRRACSHFSGQASSRARCEVAICFNRFHRPAL